MSFRSCLKASAIVVPVLGWGLLPAGHAAGPDDVDYRQNVMKTLGAQIEALELVLQGRAPAQDLQHHLAALETTSAQIVSAFEPAAAGGNARADVWEDWDDFSARASEQVERLSALRDADAAREFSPDRIREALNCTQCHDTYRLDTKELRLEAGDAPDPDAVVYRRSLMRAMDAQTAALGQILAWMVPDRNFLSHLEAICRERAHVCRCVRAGCGRRGLLAAGLGRPGGFRCQDAGPGGRDRANLPDRTNTRQGRRACSVDGCIDLRPVSRSVSTIQLIPVLPSPSRNEDSMNRVDACRQRCRLSLALCLGFLAVALVAQGLASPTQTKRWSRKAATWRRSATVRVATRAMAARRSGAALPFRLPSIGLGNHWAHFIRATSRPTLKQGSETGRRRTSHVPCVQGSPEAASTSTRSFPIPRSPGSREKTWRRSSPTSGPLNRSVPAPRRTTCRSP